MKLLPEMLAEWVQADLSPEQIGDLLTMTGFELEEILDVEGEPVLDVNIMANRGDGASVLGLAREVNAKVGGATERFRQFHPSKGGTGVPPVERPPIFPEAAEDGGSSHRRDADATFRINSPLCDVFATLSIEDVQNGESPDWLRRRLIRMGQRPRSLLVDLTNYVMLEVGQPLHAYNADQLKGQIVVREAQAGEKVTTLDEVERELKGGELLITDGSGPIGLAGIMGGASTEVHAGTTRTIIEAAHFNAQSVRATRKAHGMFTEASYRFERSVDPDLPPLALERFRTLYQEIVGKMVEAPAELATKPGGEGETSLTLRASRASKLLGYEIDRAQCAEILTALGCKANELPNDTHALKVFPPSWRPDLVSETDLVEEVGRIHGYEHIPGVLPQGTTQPGGRKGYEAWRQRVLDAAIAEGFTQVIGHSLIADGGLQDPDAKSIGPRVPASPNHQVLRSSLWPSLVSAALRGGGRDLHLLEIGRTFWWDTEQAAYREAEKIAFFSSGALHSPGLRSINGDEADFYSLKGSLTRIFRRRRPFRTVTPNQNQLDLRLHPTRQALLVGKDGNKEGSMGQIHPDLAAELGLPERTFLASFNLKRIDLPVEDDGDGLEFHGFARTPSIRRDLAIVADRELPFAKIEAAIRTAGGEFLERLWVFDLYEGPKVGEGKKSVGVAIELRKPGATFTDEEANRVRDAIAAGLAPLGATLRV